MKQLITIMLMLLCIATRGQKAIEATNEFLVTGAVTNELKFTLAAIERSPSGPIPDIVITNHKGEPRDTLKQLKGVLVKDLLKDIPLKEDNLKRFSEFYFTFVASDQYKVVYSWNEIFNSPTGNHIFIVTSINGEALQDMRSRILVVTPTDFKTGRRFIKCLSKVVVSRAEQEQP
ncbi:hypothetical protein A8C56_05550 [Niabella ginsenosidivorans]|uniref:Molybdopterin-binding protein n=1 Tax=Niabella ginsenosidivorans TaxID=1176587 RepID=A0A1A9HYP8_9BACT|nr:hypothetical protein [Niabella ginsenosidivorans]ANH80527.1 hypothetical protein A8C56_05550 [Niabella ginsenosidivorans]